MQSRPTPASAALLRIRLLVLDVDGTLTDGAMYYGPRGEALKRFHTRDGHGISAARAAGVTPAIITGEDSPIAAARARKLGIAKVFLHVKTKLPVLEGLMRKERVGWDETAYMGDDVNDLACLRAVGISACPSDAHPSVRAVCAFVSAFPGGQGAVREFCDALVLARARG